MLAHDEEGLVLVPSVLEPVQGGVGDGVGGVSGDALYAVRCVHGWVVVRPLSLQDLPEIETRGVALEVPFSDHGGLVAVLLKKLREGLLFPVKAHAVGQLSVEMAVLAREDDGPAGAQIELVTKARWKIIPSLASRSMLGVLFLFDP